jgi:integral membrane protein (TIGR01906 family)
MKVTSTKILFWIVTILAPVILILAVVRVMMTPVYIQTEYRMPGFPEDSYGFSFDERLYWANISRLYLVNRDGIEYLADQQLDENTPLYNERELRHMVDVKVVVRGVQIVLYGALLYTVALGYWARQAEHWSDFKLALSWGGWLTVGFIVAIMVYLGLNFNSLFTNFHKIFFDGDTWLFRYSDTLIRLFPVRFWRDAFIWIGTLALGSGAALGYFLGRPRG